MFSFKKAITKELNSIWCQIYNEQPKIKKIDTNIKIIKTYLLRRNIEYKKEITALKTKIQKQNEIIRMHSTSLKNAHAKIQLILKEVGLIDEN